MTARIPEPPPGIRGSMRNRPEHIRHLRDRWIRHAENLNMRRVDIAAALGVHVSTIRRVVGPMPSFKRYKGTVRPPTIPPWGQPCRWGDFTPQQREWIYRLAEHDGCESPAEWIVETLRDWLEENAEATLAGENTRRDSEPRRVRQTTAQQTIVQQAIATKLQATLDPRDSMLHLE